MSGNSYKNFYILICIALVTFGNTSEYDYDELHNLTFEELLDIEIQTGSFLELDLINSPFSLTIINKKQVYTSGARHLTELLEIYVPGFQYMYNRWNGEIWGMRGIAADRNTKFIYLVNGHKMNTQARDGATSELNIGLLNDIERVEVLRGPAGLVYGSGALAGIINVVTKKYSGKNINQGVVTLGTWDFNGGTTQVEAMVAQKIGKENNITLQLGYKKSDGTPAESTPIWGKPHWPYPFWTGYQEDYMPSAGCGWCTPGNWKLDFLWEYKNLEIEARYTHQVTNSGALFILDPWPEDENNQDTTLSSRWVKGSQEEAWTVNDEGSLEHTWWGNIDTYNNNRRQYQHDNIMVNALYKIPIGDNSLKLNASFDGNTNRINLEKRAGFESFYATEREDYIEETFGEKRYTMGAQYLINSIENLNMAAGYEFRYDVIGGDLSGNNQIGRNTKRQIVSNVNYSNNSLYFEGFYSINDFIAMHLGVRYDLHTRTQNDGGIVSPKSAIIFKPNKEHAIKLIYQSSSNNGTADSYEYNKNHFTETGETYDYYHFLEPTDIPGDRTDIVPGWTLDQLHAQKPEKIHSLELNSVHHISNITINPSVSVNRVENLFVWDQSSFIALNADTYHFMNIDVDAHFTIKGLTIGGNHTIQRPIAMDLDDYNTISKTRYHWSRYDSITTGPETMYIPIEITDDMYANDSSVINANFPQDTSNLLKKQISADGENFLNLSTQITKLYFDLTLVEGLSFHSDMRIFWGLPGRKVYMDKEPEYEYHSLDSDPMVKFNASIHWNVLNNLRVSI
ncbi:MAG: TonB-dependent receptor, partial [Fibrobacterales bacterium]